MLMSGLGLAIGGCPGPGEPASPAQVRPSPQRLVARRAPPPPRRPVDTDGDGIPDERDKCPRVKEIFNGYRDDDGCPDVVCRPMPAQVRIQAKIYFPSGSDRIQKVSHQVLDDIAQTLKDHPKLLLVEIQGHVDQVERRQRRYRAPVLSERRARAVRRYLIQRGIAAQRLVTKGYGPLRPVAPNLTARGRAQNRRVGFVILRRK